MGIVGRADHPVDRAAHQIPRIQRPGVKVVLQRRPGLPEDREILFQEGGVLGVRVSFAKRAGQLGAAQQHTAQEGGHRQQQRSDQGQRADHGPDQALADSADHRHP